MGAEAFIFLSPFQSQLNILHSAAIATESVVMLPLESSVFIPDPSSVIDCHLPINISFGKLDTVLLVNLETLETPERCEQILQDREVREGGTFQPCNHRSL